MNENYLAMTEGVKEFLMELGLEQYYEMFVTKGFDSESDLVNLQDADLDCMGISDPTHRQLLVTAALHYTPSDSYKLYEWLKQNELDYYFVNFLQSELTDFTDLANLQVPDDDLYDELEIVLPGHRKRLERAVRQLRKRRRIEQNVAEEPLVVGRWGKPSALVDAKYDFLCVEAVIASTKDAGNVRRMDFMVDSGSDVVTLREEVLESLDLELLGTVRSKGVHASREKRLYKAKLILGDREIEIEVMPESYDSLGSRVIRHFRHFIDGNRHVWLPGNYTEALPLPRGSSPSEVEASSAPQVSPAGSTPALEMSHGGTSLSPLPGPVSIAATPETSADTDGPAESQPANIATPSQNSTLSSDSDTLSKGACTFSRTDIQASSAGARLESSRSNQTHENEPQPEHENVNSPISHSLSSVIATPPVSLSALGLVASRSNTPDFESFSLQQSAFHSHNIASNDSNSQAGAESTSVRFTSNSNSPGSPQCYTKISAVSDAHHKLGSAMAESEEPS